MTAQALELLRQELLKAPSKTLETLGAALIENLIGTKVPVARSGLQHGGDAGTAGRQGRHLRMEAKRYRDTSQLSSRDLLGELQQAIANDPALEAWILVTTKAVDEQLDEDLAKSGDAHGIATIVLDWKSNGFPDLAALCSSAPHLVEATVSKDAGTSAQELSTTVEAKDGIARITRDLQVWSIGFESVRKASRDSLSGLWHSQRESRAILGQDAAGGHAARCMRRLSTTSALDSWWTLNPTSGAPAVVTGNEGVGKTWAALHWLQEKSSSLPIVLPIPASAVPYTHPTETSARELIATRLHEITGTRTLAYWLQRVDRLLHRPPSEGPVFLLLLDGLNQCPLVQWPALLQMMQSPRLVGQVRVIATTRPSYLQDKLRRLVSLTDRPVHVPVGPYDLLPGGELDQMLQSVRLCRADLHPDLIELARRPRMFNLVVRLRGTLSAGTAATVHQVLWEYGRDSLGRGETTSLSDSEWRQWLHTLAEHCKSSIARLTTREIEGHIARPTLTAQEVSLRCGDIIDGHFALASESHPDVVVFKPTIVTHALGLALLSHLEKGSPARTRSEIKSRLDTWLDPIDGLDQKADILRAAVSVLAVRGGDTSGPLGGVLVTAWLQSQNLPETHRQDLAALSGELVGPLLDAIEESTARATTDARMQAVGALQSLDWSTRIESTREFVTQRLALWTGIVSLERGVGRTGGFEKQRANRLMARIGVDSSCDVNLLGCRLGVVEKDDGVLGAAVALVLDNAKLASSLPVLVATAVAQAATGGQPNWKAIRWLVFLNSRDGAETRLALREKAKQIAPSVAPSPAEASLSSRVAALLYYLAGEEADEIEAKQIDGGNRGGSGYAEYLADPAKPCHPLERRHAAAVIADASQPLLWRLQRCSEVCLDPAFKIPNSVAQEIREWAASVDVSQLGGSRARTKEAHDFELMEPVLARVAPDLLEDVIRKKLLRMRTAGPDERYWLAANAPEHLLLASPEHADAARALREASVLTSSDHEALVRCSLLMMEAVSLPSEKQLELVRSAKLSTIFDDLLTVLRPLTREEAERAERSTEEDAHALLAFLVLPDAVLPEPIWEWGLQVAAGSGSRRGLAFEVLARADAKRFGRHLATSGWTWSPTSSNANETFFAASALIAGGISLPFDQLAMRLPPWRLLEAARRRGADPTEVRFAAEVVGRVLMGATTDAPDLGADVSVNLEQNAPGPAVLHVSERALEKSANAADAIALALDIEAHERVFAKVVDTAVARIKEARAAGAHLFMSEATVEDMLCVCKHAPEVLAAWLDGLEGLTKDLRRRIMLAEGAYLALCGALLSTDPARGVKLWHALQASLRTRFIGGAGVCELTHLAFKAPASAPVMELRSELMTLKNCNTDEELCAICLAAAWNKQEAWLESVQAEDKASSEPWRRKRALMIQRFRVHLSGSIAVTLEGETKSSYARLERESSRLVGRDGWAQTWWRAFLGAATLAEGYSAWVLFLRAVDRRGRLWLRTLRAADDAPFKDVKHAHVDANHQRMKRWIEKKEEKLRGTFLAMDIVQGIGPWSGEG